MTRWNENNPGTYANGQFVFNNTLTRSNPTQSSTGNTSGSGMASLLLGLPTTASNRGIGFTSPLSLQVHYVGLFFQDDWKVTRRLTLNLGMRYELETPPTERFDRLLYSFDPTLDLGITVPGRWPAARRRAIRQRQRRRPAAGPGRQEQLRTARGHGVFPGEQYGDPRRIRGLLLERRQSRQRTNDRRRLRSHHAVCRLHRRRHAADSGREHQQPVSERICAAYRQVARQVDRSGEHRHVRESQSGVALRPAVAVQPAKTVPVASAGRSLPTWACTA